MLHVAGTSELARVALALRLPDAEVTYSDDAALGFRSGADLRGSDELPFASNLFEVVGRTRRNELVKSAYRLAAQLPDSSLTRDRSGFRVMVHLDGKLTALDREARTTLEMAIARATGSRIVSRGSVGEFWVIGRTGSPDLLLGRRLPAGRTRSVAKGALSPDLASMLVAASRPARRDVVLDPFAGSGALVLARVASPAQRILAGERDPGRRRDLVTRLIDTDVEVRGDDARSLGLPDGLVDAIITDPPWGEFEDVGESYDAFVGQVAREMGRVLNPLRGRLVLLSSRRESGAWGQALTTAGLRLDDEIQILVHGHPASVIRGSWER